MGARLGAAVVLVIGMGAGLDARVDRSGADLTLTRDHLQHLRKTMAEAAEKLEPFGDAHEKANWTRLEKMPSFRAVNRMNAYNTFLLMEQQVRR